MSTDFSAHLSILVVEDHDALRTSLVDLLRTRGHRVEGVASAEDVFDLEALLQPELYLLDLNLPGEDGLSLARRLRQRQPGIGIIMATARQQIADKFNGYEHGADIYLTKPVDPEELLGAILAMARRLRPASPAGALILDHAALRLSGPTGEAVLTATEARLLDALAKAPEQLLERWQVAVNLGMDTGPLTESSLEVRVANLRRKLVQIGAGAKAIRAVRGFGYKLCVPVGIR